MKRSTNVANPVFISVYVESPSSPRSRKPNHPTTRIKPNSFPENPRIPRTDGYDRRAQLLAYAREMRTNGGSPPAAKHTEHKKSRWSQVGTKKLRVFLDRILPRRSKNRRYEHLGSDGDEEEEEERSATPDRANQRSKTPFYRKFSRMLRKLSCGWKCAKGLS